MREKKSSAVFAVLATALYAVNIPLSKSLLEQIGPTMMAALLYLGAGLGLALCGVIGRAAGKAVMKDHLTRAELPYVLAMVLLDIAAPILLMLGIARTSSANVSLLNNFEIVATSLVAFFVFHEALSKGLCAAIGLVTLASAILGFEGRESFQFNLGSLLVLCACVCWGFENNCTKAISSKSSVEIVMIKGCFSGLGSLAVALVLGERFPDGVWVFCALLLGFVSYGLSINFYIMAQKELGAAKTSAFYSVAPFLGVVFSMILLGERPAPQFYIALFMMLLAAALLVKDVQTAAGELTC